MTVCDRCLHPIHDTTVDDVVEAAVALFGIPEADLLDHRRQPDLQRARQLTWYVAHDLGHSYPQIGNRFDRDHTTIMYGVRRLRVLLAADTAGVRRRVDALMEAVQ